MLNGQKRLLHENAQIPEADLDVCAKPDQAVRLQARRSAPHGKSPNSRGRFGNQPHAEMSLYEMAGGDSEGSESESGRSGWFKVNCER